MNVTEIREAVKERLRPFGETQVWLSPTEYGRSFGDTDEIKLNAKIIVGSVGDEGIEEKIDELFNAVPNAFAEDRTLGGVAGDCDVVACSGHKMFNTGLGSTPLMGADWTLKVLAE